MPLKNKIIILLICVISGDKYKEKTASRRVKITFPVWAEENISKPFGDFTLKYLSKVHTIDTNVFIFLDWMQICIYGVIYNPVPMLSLWVLCKWQIKSYHTEWTVDRIGRSRYAQTKKPQNVSQLIHFTSIIYQGTLHTDT